MNRKRVLVLCTGNSCRSQMAEGWIRHMLGDRVEVCSAGTAPSRVHPLAVRVMKEAGVDISYQRSKSVDEFIGEPFDLVITVCDHARETCPHLPGAVRRIHESIDDPAIYGSGGELALQKFRETRDVIRDRVVARVREELLESRESA